MLSLPKVPGGVCGRMGGDEWGGMGEDEWGGVAIFQYNREKSHVHLTF